MRTVDFEKAFDTEFQLFNKDTTWIQFQTNLHPVDLRAVWKCLKLCVEQGFFNRTFLFRKRCKKRRPSPYLFSYYCFRSLGAIRIRNDDTIQGFTFGEENAKLNLFADDITCFVNDKGSYINLFRLEDFAECSGLKVNYEKTEALAFGDSSLCTHFVLLLKF